MINITKIPSHYHKKTGDINDDEDEGSTESETEHGTGLTKGTSSDGATRSRSVSVMNSNPQVTVNPGDQGKKQLHRPG